MIPRIAKVTISREESNQRLDYWLASRFNYHSRSQWQRLIRNGKLLINEERVKSSCRIRLGDCVRYDCPNTPEPEASMEFHTVYEDAEILAVNKPGNLPCHPSGKFFRNTLWYRLKNTLVFCSIINRLDRETSGLVLVGKTKNATRIVSNQFKFRKIHKAYLALVYGRFPEFLRTKGQLCIDKSSKIRKKRVFLDDDKNFNTITVFKRVDAQAETSLVLAIPETGKTHQIRASLLSLGYPIIGDKIYGKNEEIYLQFIAGKEARHIEHLAGAKRQMLHAYRLTYADPTTQQSRSLIAKLPRDFTAELENRHFGRLQSDRIDHLLRP